MMQRHVWRCSLVLALLAGCGSSTGGDEATPGASGSGDEQPETSAGSDEYGAADEEDEPATVAADGSRCLPVARCASFGNQSCALVDADGRPMGDDGEPMAGARVREACPGERGVAPTVEECFEYVESEATCRRPPDILPPQWPCGRSASGGCEIQML